MFIRNILLVFTVIYIIYQPAFSVEKHVNIGVASKADTLDPHLRHDGANWSLHANLYQTLTISGEVKLHDALDKTGIRKTQGSGIVKSYSFTQDQLRLTLKSDIVFHDGTPLDSADVVYTLQRIKELGDKSAFIRQINGIKTITASDKYQVNLELKKGLGLQEVLGGLITIFIIKKGSADKPIGSGPFMIASHSHNLDKIHLKAFSDYKGVKAAVESANYIYISDKEIRLKQFLAGKLDILEKITPKDVLEIKQKGTYRFNSVESSRLILLYLDQNRDSSPYIQDHTGKPLNSNPLKNLQVRQAISLAIDRKGIVDKVLYGGGTPAGQLLNTVHPHHIKSINPDTYNPKKAKKLLSEAGYPKGFRITIHSPNNRYMEDENIARHIATMLTDVGIKTTLTALPKRQFFKELDELKYSFALSGWSGTDLVYHLKNLIATQDKSNKVGTYNSGLYSNPKTDQLIHTAIRSTSNAERISLAKQAMVVAMKDKALIPLHFEKKTWASRPPWSIDASYHSFSQLLNIKFNP